MSNLINNDLPPPPDTSSLAAAAADAAKTDPNGDAAFIAQKNLEAAQFQAQRFQEHQAYIDKQNAPVYAEMRADQDKQTNAVLTGAVAAVGTLAVLDVALNSGPGLGTALSGVFGGLTGRGASTEDNVTAAKMGPTAAFAGYATKTETLARTLGRTPPEETMKLGPAFISPAYIEQAAAPSEPEGPTQTAARAPQRPVNNAYALTNDAMSKGPKPPSWASGTNGGSSTA